MLPQVLKALVRGASMAICKSLPRLDIFYRAALTAGRSSREKAVCPSVRLSVCLANAWIVTKWKKRVSRLLYHMKDYLA